MTAFPEVTEPGERGEVLLRYLDYFRGVLVAKLEGLSEERLRTSALPSGWAPIELIKHLTAVEMRWLEWGFEGLPMDDPWPDERSGRWYVGPEETLAELVAGLGEQAARSRAIVLEHHLLDVGQPGERWRGRDPANLERVLLHLVQEYARHVGHLDIVRELADGAAGEDRPA